MNSTLALLLVVAVACVSSISAMSLNEMDLDSLLKLDTIDEVQGADEFGAGATGVVCPSTDFTCVGSGVCIPIAQRCNGVANQCSDNSDEWGCGLPKCTDAVHGFTCVSPAVARSPQPVNCAAIPCTITDCCSTCTSGSYSCADGSCVSKANPKCDYVKDCADNSDEWGCALPKCNDATYGAVCSGTTSTPRSVTAKNIWAANCAQGPCTQAECCHGCSSTQFACSSGLCVTGTPCNGVKDCVDGSDEWSCPLPTCTASVCSGSFPTLKTTGLPANCGSLTCTQIECCTACNVATDFTCYDQGTPKCVVLAKKCDGVKDCGDNSDEWGCPFATCAKAGFACATGTTSNGYTGDCLSVGSCTQAECCK